MTDVLIVGGGPAGAVAATVLARAGARVRLLDRATFPRPKLCGDTLNPGTLAMLRRLRLGSIADACGRRVDGMILTGEGGVAIEGRYPRGLHGRSISRADFDLALVRDAQASGVDVMEGIVVREPLLDDRHGAVIGVRTSGMGRHRDFKAPVTIAADGRHSTLAFGLGLARHPRWPRRWAIGAYATGVEGDSSFGEMHIRRGHYIGVAPLPHGLTNVCLVMPSAAGDPLLRDPSRALSHVLAAEPLLADRFSRAMFVAGPTVLGPLAVDVVGKAPVPNGLLLAGDAAGFVDPMTGDGLRFAVRGGEMAAGAALEALEYGWANVARLAEAQRREFHAKRRFNRVLRALVGSPLAVQAAATAAPFVTPLLHSLICRAGDCDLVEAR